MAHNKLWYLDAIETDRYKYISDNSKVRIILENAKKEKIAYDYVLIHLIKKDNKTITGSWESWLYFSVHFMNNNNHEVAYAILDTFDMLGFTTFETPRVWGTSFLIKKDYYRYNKEDIKRMMKEGKNVYRPEEAANFNNWFKNSENNQYYL